MNALILSAILGVVMMFSSFLLQSKAAVRNTGIAGMALLIAAENKFYKVGDVPSANAIAEGIGVIFDALPNANLKGLCGTNIRTAINLGLKLLEKPKK